jgi:Cytosol aminopeptidase family, N-terminal domain
MSTGIVVGVNPDGQHSSAAPSVSSQWKASGAKPKPGELRVFYDVQGKHVAAVGTGKPVDSDDAKKEQTRKMVGALYSPGP